jgi:hypothetical protein
LLGPRGLVAGHDPGQHIHGIALSARRPVATQEDGYQQQKSCEHNDDERDHALKSPSASPTLV